MRKRINDSVQKWNHTLAKNSGNKKIGGQKKGTVEFGKIFGYDIGKTVSWWESRFISTNG
jgi:hypothetical protein